MNGPDNREVSCNNCSAACCRKNTLMTLTAPEADFMRKGGTVLATVFEADPSFDWSERMRGAMSPDPKIQELISAGKRLKKGEGSYLLTTDCGYLVEGDDWPQCSVYLDPSRPNICKNFQVGSRSCRWIREVRGVDLPANSNRQDNQ